MWIDEESRQSPVAGKRVFSLQSSVFSLQQESRQSPVASLQSEGRPVGAISYKSSTRQDTRTGAVAFLRIANCELRIADRGCLDELESPPLSNALRRSSAQYPQRRSAVMPLLYIAMREDGRLTDEGMRQVAQLTGLTSVQVESVASFYSMYKRHVGAHVVSVCTSISCHLLGGRELLATMSDETGVPPGETAVDGSITVESVECIGACGGAPAVQVDYELVEGVTPEKGRELCRWLRAERPTLVRADELQRRFGGIRSFPAGADDPVGAVGPFPAFGPIGTAGGGS